MKTIIKIDGKKNYTPATFTITDDGIIWVYSESIGIPIKHPELNTVEKLENHIRNMVREGFTVVIRSQK